MALGTPASNVSSESRGDFPFPAQGSSQSGTESPRSVFADMMRQHSSRPKLSSRKTEPVLRPVFSYISALTKQGQLATSDARDQAEKVATTPPITKPEPSLTETQGRSESDVDVIIGKRPPRILLADDNKINLRLLETFMRKRKYQFVDSAEDGAMAVEAAKSHVQGYDVIFMVGNGTSKVFL